MSQTKFFVSHLEQKQGPFSLEEIQQKFNQNTLFPTDYIFDDSKNDWVLLFEFLQNKKSANDLPTVPPAVPVQSLVADLHKKFDSVAPRTMEHTMTGVTAVTHVGVDLPPTRTMTVNFKNGVQTIELKAERVEKLKLQVVDQKTGVKSKEIVEMEVNSGPAEALVVTIPESSRAGEILKVSILAVDNWKNRDEKYNGRIRIDISPSLKGSGDWEIKNGLLEISFVPSVSTKYTFRAESLEMQKLKTADPKTTVIKPGPAVTFTIEKPQNVRLGETVSIRIKAVDAFGNVDPDYQGSAVLNLDKINRVG